MCAVNTLITPHNYLERLHQTIMQHMVLHGVDIPQNISQQKWLQLLFDVC